MNFKIEKTNLEEDLPQLDVWDKQISNHNNKFSSIKDYILEGNTYYTLREVISLNHERYPIGDDERKYCFSIKDNSNKFLGFIMCILFNMQQDPELFIQYVVIHPDVQHKHIGSDALRELMFSPQKYIEKSPVLAQAYVNKTNIPSLMMFRNLGFEYSDASENYLRAEKNILENIREK